MAAFDRQALASNRSRRTLSCKWQLPSLTSMQVHLDFHQAANKYRRGNAEFSCQPTQSAWMQICFRPRAAAALRQVTKPQLLHYGNTHKLAPSHQPAGSLHCDRRLMVPGSVYRALCSFRVGRATGIETWGTHWDARY